MRKIRYKIIYILGLVVLSLCISVVFASFIFDQVAVITGEFGKIHIDHTEFYDYSLSKNSNDERINKMRKDTVCVIEGITFNSDKTHTLTEDGLFINGKQYYKKVDDEYVLETVVVGDPVPENTYYELTEIYTSINAITSLYYYNGSEIIEVDLTDVNISHNETTSSIAFELNAIDINITCIVEPNFKGVKSASIEASGDKEYKVVIDSSGKGLVVLDTVVDTENLPYTTVSATSAIECSATDKKYDLAHNQNKIYLSQLGLHFEFTSEVAVYVRIHIQDAWKRIRAYSSSVKESYILKDQINGKSPFLPSDTDKWFYDDATNCVYLKEMYVPERDGNGNLINQSYTFNINEGYFYNALSSTAYTEYVDVQVSFTVDIVQANRAKALWKIDPSNPLGN